MVKKVTMDDIARELNISKSLVSLALSGKYGVSDETRSEIVFKALQMGYNLPEKKGKRNVIRKIALVIHRMSDLNSRFWREIIRGAQKVLIENKVTLNIVSWNDALSETEVLQSLYDLHLDGILILNRCPAKLLELIYNLKTPIVLIDFMDCVDNKYSQVRANNYLGGYEAAKYLVSKGHKKLIFFGNFNFSYSFHQRYYGFNDYVLSCGGCVQSVYLADLAEGAKERFLETYDENLLICYPDQLKRFLQEHSGYTAIMCENDAVAEMALKILKELNLQAGKDISLMTFDNTRICEKSDPPLSSINIPKEVMGKKAVQMLFSLISDKNNQEDFPSVVEVNTEIIERESVLDLKN